MRSVAGGIDGLGAVFDDGSLVADAGLLLAGTVMSRLGLEALIDETVRPGGSAGSGAGRRVRGRVARCCLWWRRCWWAGAASTMCSVDSRGGYFGGAVDRAATFVSYPATRRALAWRSVDGLFAADTSHVVNGNEPPRLRCW